MWRLAATGLELALLLTAPARSSIAWNLVRNGDVIQIAASELSVLDGTPIARLTVLACAPAGCAPIPFQVDERTADGRWALEQGPEPTRDDPPDVLDANDALLFMAMDAGDRAGRTVVADGMVVEITLRDPLDGTQRWVYVVAAPVVVPRAAANYVAYDRDADRIRGAHVSLGFDGGVPNYLAVADGANLLDRLKVRATATFLWGLIRFSRSEADLTTQFVAWRQGPIRVIRQQRQWVRLGWGIHSPTFGSYTYFYRDFAELPVGLRLNFPPTYFFGDIDIQVVLDFRDLSAWSLLVPSLGAAMPLGHISRQQLTAVNAATDTWFGLRGPEIALVQRMEVSPSLSTVRRRLLLRSTDRPVRPESVRGEHPGIGYELDRWEQVPAGAHALQAVCYAVPLAMDLVQFIAARETRLQVEVHQPAGDLDRGAGGAFTAGVGSR